MSTPRTFEIRTFGCQMNEHDSERLAGQLLADGYVPVNEGQVPDVVLLNTCCVRENADNRLYGTLGHLKSLKDENPGLQIAVGGCLAQKDRDTVLRRAPWVDVVVGTHNLTTAPSLLARSREVGSIIEILDGPDPENREMAPALNAVRELDFAAWVSIQTGCDNSCAFCIVPSVRGPEVSRPFDDLVEEVRTLSLRGVSEVTLLGQNVNSYGRDLTRRRPLFADLLRAVGAVEGIERVRYTSPHPKDLRPETIAAMAETDAVCNQLHLPIQSGSDRVLRAMRRGYTAERYLERLASARAAIDDLAVTTDIIVGFPGETEEEFAQTLEVAAFAEFDSAYTFIFSPREGTRAAAMQDQFVAPEVIKERFARLEAVIDRAGIQRHADRVGRVEELLMEGPSRRDPLMASGRTRQGKLCHVPDVEGALRPGSVVLARVVSASPHHLMGEMTEVIHGPRHRTKIPLTVS